MLVPRDSVVDFFIRSEGQAPIGRCCLQTTGTPRLVEYFTARVSESRDNNRLLPLLRELCLAVAKLDDTKGLAMLPANTVDGLLKALVLAQDLEFLDQATSKLGSYPLPTFLEWIVSRVEAGELAPLMVGKQ